MRNNGPGRIIVFNPGGFAKYLLGCKVDEADNRRRPLYTTDIEKAKRFWTDVDAHNYVTLFSPDPNKSKYSIESYSPAEVLN